MGLKYLANNVLYRKEITFHSDGPIKAIYKTNHHHFSKGENLASKELLIKQPTIYDSIIVYQASDTSKAILKKYHKNTSLKGKVRNLTYFLYNHAYLSILPKENSSKLIVDLRKYSVNNIAHILSEFIPICLELKSEISDEIIFISEKPIKPFKDLLAFFDIELHTSDKEIKGKFIKIKAVRGFSAFNFDEINDIPPYCFLNQTYNGFNFKKAEGYEKIFFNRKDQRALINKKEVDEMISANGYKTVYLEDFSIEEQIAIAVSAKEVIAIHGAAMAYLLLSKKIDLIIEIFPPNVNHEYFPVLLQHKTKQYIQLNASFDEKIQTAEWSEILHYKNQPFELDLGLLEYTLNTINEKSN